MPLSSQPEMTTLGIAILKTMVVLYSYFLGLLYGGFFMVWLFRFGRDVSMTAKSRCPVCGSQVKRFQEIPVFSWLFLRGRCRSCHTKVSVGYPLGEAACSLIFGTLAWIWVGSANSVDEINRGLGYAYWMGFCALVLWSSALFRHRKVRTPWAFRFVIIALVAAVFLPSRFLFVPFCEKDYLLPVVGKADYFTNFLLLSTCYSIAVIVGLTYIRDLILKTVDKTKLNLAPAIQPKETRDSTTDQS